MSSDLSAAFRDWENTTARRLNGHHTLTVGIRIEDDNTLGTHWNISGVQEARLAALLRADAASLGSAK